MPETDSLIALSEQFFIAVNFLKDMEYLKDEGVYDLIKEKCGNPKKGMSYPYLNKLKNAWKNTENLKDTNLRTYNRVIGAVNQIILEKHLAHWDTNQKAYQKKETKLLPDISKLLTLNGHWVGYTFNKVESSRQDKVVLNSFKMHIKTLDDIHCHTELGIFTSKPQEVDRNPKESETILLSVTEISTVSADRIEIRLESLQAHIKLVLMAHIGLAGENGWNTLPKFTFAYVNSGKKKVKAGLGKVYRAAQQEFFDIIPGKVNPYTGPDDKLTEFLNDTQLVLD